LRTERFRVVLSNAIPRDEAVQRLETLTKQHPELFLRVLPAKTDSREKRYQVVVGGTLNRNEADQLFERVLNKGLKTAHVERDR